MSQEGVVHLHPDNTEVRSILAHALNKAAEYEIVIVIVKDKAGDMRIGHSDGQLLEKAGLCSTALTRFTHELLM